MKHSIRTLTPVIALMLLSACGKTNTMNSPYGAYPQQMGQMAYSQPGMQNGQMVNGQMVNGQVMSGQTSYAQTGTQTQPMAAPAAPQAQTARAAAPAAKAAAPTAGGRTAPTLNKASSTTTKAPATTAKAPATAPAAKAPAPAAAKAPDASEYLTKARQAIGSLQSLSATVATFEKGQQAGQGKIQYLYRAGQVKIDVVSSSDSSRQGVKLAFQSGGNQVRVRPSGVLSMVALNLPMNDGKLLSGRKYQIGQIELTATVNRLSQAGAQAKVLGKTTFAGAEVIVIEITAPNPFDNRITKEHLGLDAQSFLPRIHEMYQGSELVYAGRVETLNINPQLPGNAFEV